MTAPTTPESPPTSGTSATRRVLGRVSIGAITTIEVLGFCAQLFLIWLGLLYIMGDEADDYDDISNLLVWCMVGTVYLLGTALWLTVTLRFGRSDPPVVRNLAGGRLARLVSLGIMFCSSLVGLTAAIELILVRDLPDHTPFYELSAVWAMLVSWVLFHWGYARLYHSYYYRSVGARPLRFPDTEEPRLSDFAYFAFTNGTSFAVNDVTVMTSRMRWVVVWHTTLSFFFNALIIVLTMNTIVGGLNLEIQ